MNSLDTIAGVIKNRKKFILCGHIMPDGDSLGSVLALGTALNDMGKEVTLLSPDPVPENLAFLPGVRDIIPGGKELPGDFDVALLLDCSVPERLGACQRILEWNITTVNIDHHPDNGIEAEYNYVDPQAAATGEIIYDMLVMMGHDINLNTAICLYTAITTDTGSFQYENTTPATHRRIANLLECGIKPGELNVMIYDEMPLPSLLLLRNVLQNLKVSNCGQVAWMSVFRQDLDQVNARDEHTESMINYPRSIKGVKVAVLFRELGEGEFKLSFRSKGSVNVNLLASQFGGGGHDKASGCILRGNYAEIESKVVNAALKALEDKRGE